MDMNTDARRIIFCEIEINPIECSAVYRVNYSIDKQHTILVSL